MKYQLSIKLLFVLPFSYGAPVVAEDMGKNLKTCLAGKYESLCKEDLLTKLQSKQLAVRAISLFIVAGGRLSSYAALLYSGRIG
jgi:hypothetical protein